MTGQTSEILARLGIDTKQVPQDLAGAKEFFRKFSQEAEAISGKAGETAGSKFGKSMASQLSGQARGALAAAVGFTAKGISEQLAGWLTGGTAKEWEEFGRIADENSKRIGERIRKNLSSAQLVQALEKDLAAAQQREAKAAALTNGGSSGILGKIVDVATKPFQWSSGAKSDAQLSKEAAEAKKETLETEDALAEARKKAADEEKRFLQAVRDYNYEIASDANKRKMLEGEVSVLQKEILSGTLGEKELKEKHLELLDRDAKLRAVSKQIAEETRRTEEKAANDKKKAQDEEAKRLEKLSSLNKRNRDLQKTEKEILTQMGDKSKLTVGELAAIDGNKFGVGVDAGNAARRAREIQEIEAEAERRRISGDFTGSAESLANAGRMKNELIDQGFLKSTENENSELVQKLEETREAIVENLDKIDETLKGKFVNE